MNTIKSTLYTYLTSSQKQMISLYSSLAERLFTKSDSEFNNMNVTIAEFKLQTKEAIDLLNHLFLLLDNNHKIKALNKITKIFLVTRPLHSEPSKCQKKTCAELAAFYCSQIKLINSNITIIPMPSKHSSDVMLIDNVIRTKNNTMLDATLCCDIDINSGIVDNKGVLTKTQFSSAISTAENEDYIYAIKSLLKTHWDSKIKVNAHAIALLYIDIETALTVYESNLKFDDYKDIKLEGLYCHDGKNWLESIIKKLYGLYGTLYSPTTSDYDKIIAKEAQEKLSHIKVQISKLANVKDDFKAIINRATVLEYIIIQVKELTKENFRRKSNEKIASITNDVIATLQPELNTTNILTDTLEDLPATMFKLSKVNYGEALVLTVKSDPQFLIRHAKSAAQVEYLTSLYDINPIDSLSLIEKEPVKKQFLKRVI